MRDLRMPKGWTLFGVNTPMPKTDAQRRKETKQWAKEFRNKTSPSIEDMIKNAETSYQNKIANKEFLEANPDKLWSAKKKEESKRAKAKERKVKRLARKKKTN